MRVARRALPLLLALVGSSPVTVGLGVEAQEEDRGAYFRAVGDYFGVATGEVHVLAEWTFPPDHVPAVLDLARRAGVSADALVALRRDDRGWGELAREYGVSAGDFHVPLPEGAPAGPLDRAYEAFRSTPRERWDTIELREEELVHLVNLRFLTEYVGVTPVRVLEAAERAGSYVGAYDLLVGSSSVGFPTP